MQRRQVAQPVHVDPFLVERAQAGDMVLRHETVGDISHRIHAARRTSSVTSGALSAATRIPL